MANSILTNLFVDDIPASTRPGAGNRTKTTTDEDVALKQLVNAYNADGQVRTLQFRDYNFEIDDASKKNVPVEKATAVTRAAGRIKPLKGRGYTTEAGWVLASREGKLYAQFYGAGNVPEDKVRKTREAKAAEDTAAAEAPVGERVPAPV